MKTSFNISILGGRGYVGQEIIKIINNHPNFFISDIYSKTSQGKLVDDYTKSKSLTYKLLDSPDKLDFSDTDIVIASAMAYLNALNKLVSKSERAHPQV